MIAKFKDVFVGFLIFALVLYFFPAIFTPLVVTIIVYASLVLLVIGHFELQQRLWAIFFIGLIVLFVAVTIFGFSPTLTPPSLKF